MSNDANIPQTEASHSGSAGPRSDFTSDNQTLSAAAVSQDSTFNAKSPTLSLTFTLHGDGHDHDGPETSGNRPRNPSTTSRKRRIDEEPQSSDHREKLAESTTSDTLGEGVNFSTDAGARINVQSHLDEKRRLGGGENAEPSIEMTPTSIPNSTDPTNSMVLAAAPNKRPRMDDEDSASGSGTLSQASIDSAEPLKSSPLLGLPLELLSEVLILTGSPKHVLAVARTCQALCHTLLGPDAQFIWREARRGLECSWEVEDRESVITVVNWLQNPVAPLPPMVAFAAGVPVPGVATQAKQKQLIQLPDLPKKIFSEAAYAAFVFSGGPCDICGKEIDMPYDSFALRIRRCNNQNCERPDTVVQLNRASHEQLKWILPANESAGFGAKHAREEYWPYESNSYSTKIYCLRSDVEAASPEYTQPLEDEEVRQRFETLKQRNKEWMELCVKLAKWKLARNRRRQEVKKTNVGLTKVYADTFGWEHRDILGCTVFGRYQKHKTNLLEVMTEIDIIGLRDQIESELLEVFAKRERCNMEISLMENRKDVEVLYNRLRSAKSKYPYLPSLVAFRELPVVGLLQSAEHIQPRSKAGVSSTLQSNLIMKELLENHLKQWVDAAKSDLAVVLGFPKTWKTANKNLLHPVERVTARFLCVKCEKVERKYQMDGCFDFAGACQHQCIVGNKGRLRKGAKAQWEASNFAKDDKAIRVLKKGLLALGYVDEKDIGNYMLKVGIATLCTSCDPPMVVDSRSLIGHCHRHDDMQLAFLTSVQKTASYLGGHPYEYGLAQKFFHPSASFANSIKQQIAQKNFGCRHCLRQKQVEKESVAGAASGEVDVQGNLGNAHAPAFAAPSMFDIDRVDLATVAPRIRDLNVEGPREKPPPLFDFNGLRSHLKAKHGVLDIRDEDLLCYEAMCL